MDTRLLRYFSVLAEELHFGRAAKRLFISQPPLSRQIKLLEEDLGVQLFHRTKRNVELTDYGVYLRDESYKLFNQMDMMKNHLRLMKNGISGQIKMSYVGDFMYTVLPEILAEIAQQYPRIETILMEFDTESQINGLRTGLIDLGFIRTPVETKGIKTRLISKETFSLILPLSHPLASSDKVPLEEMKGEPYIGLSPRCTPPIRESVLSICQRAGFSPEVVHRAGQVNSIVKLVENNMGFSIIPSGLRKTFQEKVKFFELRDHPERAELSLAYHLRGKKEVTGRIVNLILKHADISS